MLYTLPVMVIALIFSSISFHSEFSAHTLILLSSSLAGHHTMISANNRRTHQGHWRSPRRRRRLLLNILLPRHHIDDALRSWLRHRPRKHPLAAGRTIPSGRKRHRHFFVHCNELVGISRQSLFEECYSTPADIWLPRRLAADLVIVLGHATSS